MTPEQAASIQRAIDAALYETLPEPEVTEFFGALGVLLYRAECDDFQPTMPMELMP